MRRFTKALMRFVKAEDGPTAVEYAIMLVMIIVVCIGAVTTIGSKTNSSYTRTYNKVSAGS